MLACLPEPTSGQHKAARRTFLLVFGVAQLSIASITRSPLLPQDAPSMPGRDNFCDGVAEPVRFLAVSCLPCATTSARFPGPAPDRQSSAPTAAKRFRVGGRRLRPP